MLVCAHELGFYTVFNPAPACELPAEVWSAVDLVCPNETECQVLTGILPADDASCVAALNALLVKGAGAAVITLGGAGSVTLGDDGELLRMPALSSAVVDTTARAIHLSVRLLKLVWRACRSLSAWRWAHAPRR